MQRESKIKTPNYILIFVGLFFIYDGTKSLLAGEYILISRAGNIMGYLDPPASTVISIASIIFGILINFTNLNYFMKWFQKRISRGE